MLQRPHRHAGCRHLRTESVPELVKGDPVYISAVERLLEPADELRAVKRPAGLRMAEDEVAVMRVVGALAQLAERDRDAFGIGTDRPDTADFGSPNSPRTNGETTRSLRASRSTSRQRSPSSSP